MRKNVIKKILTVFFALLLTLGMGVQVLASPDAPENDEEARLKIDAWENGINDSIGNGSMRIYDDSNGIPSDWNTLPAGTYYLKSKKDMLFEKSAEFMEEYYSEYEDDEAAKESYKLKGLFDTVSDKYNDFMADSHRSTESTSGGGSSSSGSGSGGGSHSGSGGSSGSGGGSGSGGAAPSAGGKASKIRAYEKTMDIFQRTAIDKINATLMELNAAVASGDTDKVNAVINGGVTIDTSVWRSFNKKVYQQIESSNIPFTVNFLHKGVKYSVTIPAGAKVTELCDKNGWCGFLNLAAHYGAIVLEK